MNTIALILDSWTAFMWRRFGQPDVSQQVVQGRSLARRKSNAKRHMSHAEAAWLCVAALLAFWGAVVVVWRAWA